MESSSIPTNTNTPKWKPNLNRAALVAIHGKEYAAEFELGMIEAFENHQRWEREGGESTFWEDPTCTDLDVDDDATYDIVPAFTNHIDTFPGAELKNKWARRSDALFNRRPLKCPCEDGGMAQRYTCIWSGGGIDSYEDALTGFTWVAVHGMNSVCVATRIQDLDRELNLRKDMYGNDPGLSLGHFTNGLIGEVEAFVDPHGFPGHHLHLNMKKPYGIVSSLALSTKPVDTPSDDEALNDAEYDEEKAIKFLQDKIESGAVFTYNKTVQTTICALNHLFGNELKYEEIKVFVSKKKDGGEAKALTHVEMEEHISALNNNRDRCMLEDDVEKEEIVEIEEEEKLAAIKNHPLREYLNEFSNMEEIAVMLEAKNCQVQKEVDEARAKLCRPICKLHSTLPVTRLPPK